jgi:hypothetical protein
VLAQPAEKMLQGLDRTDIRQFSREDFNLSHMYARGRRRLKGFWGGMGLQPSR